MDQDLKNIEPLVYQSKISVPYFWWAGETASRFLDGLAVEKKIQGTKCGKCQKVFVPPRKACPQCHHKEMSWTDLPPEGTLVSFTVARRQLAAVPREVPVVYGLVRLDGADTSILHQLGEVDPDKVSIGMRVCAKFVDETPEAKTIMAIEYFKPV